MMEEDDTDSDEEPLKGGDVESGSTASKNHLGCSWVAPVGVACCCLLAALHLKFQHAT